MNELNSHCSYCGAAFAPDQPWPRLCTACGNTSFRNPLPVVVALVPCEQGVLLVRRAIEPRLGKLALPGGYINYGESWQQAAAREVQEETGVLISPGEVQEFLLHSAPDSTLIVVGLVKPQACHNLFLANEEVSEIVFTRQPIELAFPLHTAALQAYFTQAKGT